MKTEDYIGALFDNLNDRLDRIENKLDKIQTETIPEMKVEQAKLSTKTKAVIGLISTATSIIVGIILSLIGF